MALEYQPRLITVEEYHKMLDAEVFAPDERLELLDGEIIVKPVMKPPHVASIARLNQLLVTRLLGRALVIPQVPIVLNRISEPEPDFSILIERDDFYGSRRTTPKDAYALIECADSSLAFDRGKKLRAYAKSGVAEYWIVNLRGRQVEIHRGPHELGYAEPIVAKPGDAIGFTAFPDVTFTVDELLGPPIVWEGDPS